MRYKLVIFDFDGTLADSFPWALTILNDVADLHGLRHVDHEEIDMLRGMTMRAVARHMRVPWYKVPGIARDMRSMMMRDIDRIPLIEGMDDLLARLDTLGVQMAVVSSNTRENVRRVLGPVNATRIDYYECGVALMNKTGRFRKILKRSKVRAQEALCIGDELRDLEAAHKAHIPFGGVTWGYNLPDLLQKHSPRAMFSNVRDIEAEILGG